MSTMSDATAAERDSEKGQLRDAPQEMEPKDPDVVNFDGPEDAENPMNWSAAKKSTQIIIVTSMTLLS